MRASRLRSEGSGKPHRQRFGKYSCGLDTFRNCRWLGRSSAVAVANGASEVAGPIRIKHLTRLPVPLLFGTHSHLNKTNIKTKAIQDLNIRNRLPKGILHPGVIRESRNSSVSSSRLVESSFLGGFKMIRLVDLLTTQGIALGRYLNFAMAVMQGNDPTPELNAIR